MWSSERLFCYMGYSTSHKLALILYDVLPNNLGADTELHYQTAIAGVNALGIVHSQQI